MRSRNQVLLAVFRVKYSSQPWCFLQRDDRDACGSGVPTETTPNDRISETRIRRVLVITHINGHSERPYVRHCSVRRSWGFIVGDVEELSGLPSSTSLDRMCSESGTESIHA